jgi:hypothetical protein
MDTSPGGHPLTHSDWANMGRLCESRPYLARSNETGPLCPASEFSGAGKGGGQVDKRASHIANVMLAADRQQQQIDRWTSTASTPPQLPVDVAGWLRSFCSAKHRRGYAPPPRHAADGAPPVRPRAP